MLEMDERKKRLPHRPWRCAADRARLLDLKGVAVDKPFNGRGGWQLRITPEKIWAGMEDSRKKQDKWNSYAPSYLFPEYDMPFIRNTPFDKAYSYERCQRPAGLDRVFYWK